MLTGTKAVRPATPPSTSPTSTCTATSRRRRRRVPTVPAELDQLVALATARDPDRRPATPTTSCEEVRRVAGDPDADRAGPSPRSDHRGLEHDRRPSPCRARAATPATGTPPSCRSRGRPHQARPAATRTAAGRPLDRPAAGTAALAAASLRSGPRWSGSPPSPGGSSWPVPARARPSPRWSRLSQAQAQSGSASHLSARVDRGFRREGQGRPGHDQRPRRRRRRAPRLHRPT